MRIDFIKRNGGVVCDERSAVALTKSDIPVTLAEVCLNITCLSVAFLPSVKSLREAVR